MKILPDPSWEEHYAKRLRAAGWVCHPPGQSCVGATHAFNGKRSTSHAASVYVLPRTGTQRYQILDALKLGPATDPELQQLLGLSPNSERPRRLELVEGGFVRDSGRVRRHHGMEHTVWEICDDSD
jgi:hypothetical protein